MFWNLVCFNLFFSIWKPWVFAASVRQNILFGQDYDHNRYLSVVRSCALLRDYEQFENGDRTIIGEKGTLSGGQKARIKYAIQIMVLPLHIFIENYFYFTKLQFGTILLSKSRYLFIGRPIECG